jgi:hypothetical protein
MAVVEPRLMLSVGRALPAERRHGGQCPPYI